MLVIWDTITFGDKKLTVEVHHSGLLQENIPLLVGKSDTLTIQRGEVRLTRAGRIFSIKFDPQIAATTLETGLAVGPRRVVTVRLKSQNNLSYWLDFSGI